MDGLQLAHFVRGRWPLIKIIATSGRAQLRHYELPDGGRFVSKPYARAEVAEALFELTSEA
jgi:hypothetical protein